MQHSVSLGFSAISRWTMHSNSEENMHDNSVKESVSIYKKINLFKSYNIENKIKFNANTEIKKKEHVNFILLI